VRIAPVVPGVVAAAWSQARAQQFHQGNTVQQLRAGATAQPVAGLARQESVAAPARAIRAGRPRSVSAGPAPRSCARAARPRRVTGGPPNPRREPRTDLRPRWPSPKPGTYPLVVRRYCSTYGSRRPSLGPGRERRPEGPVERGLHHFWGWMRPQASGRNSRGIGIGLQLRRPLRRRQIPETRPECVQIVRQRLCSCDDLSKNNPTLLKVPPLIPRHRLEVGSQQHVESKRWKPFRSDPFGQ
jgi:hypothetical protein